MVRWYLSNAAQLLEKLRSYLGGSERPDNLFWYSGVLPTLDVSTLTPGIVKVVAFGSAVVSSLGVNSNGSNISAPAGKKWKVLSIGAYTNAQSSPVLTLSGVGISTQGTGSPAYLPLSYNLEMTTFTANRTFLAVTLGFPFYVTELDQVVPVAFCDAYTSGTLTIQFAALVLEEPAVTQ